MSPDYIQKVGNAFLQCSGRGLMLSPRDQELVASWEKAGIPSDVVIQGIEAAFEDRPTRRVNSIAFASSSIERAAKTWRSRRVGSGDESIDHRAEWETALDELLMRLHRGKKDQKDGAMHEIFDIAILGIEEIGKEWRKTPGYSVPTALEQLEDRVYNEALNTLHPLERLELERAVEGALDREHLNAPSIRAQTKRAFTHRRIRKRTGLPVFEIDPSGGW